jgi:ABC-type uncharacterized transport system substrate-binding protein
MAMFSRATLSALACALCLTLPLARPAGAHPHIFVDAGLRVIHDAGGQLSAVEVIWRYDALYSLLLASDFGLDPDGDLELTAEEAAEILGFDLNWGEGFEGGLVLRQDGVPLTLGAPVPLAVRMLPNGQLETTHRRPVLTPSRATTLEAQIYDPEFYVAFEMILAVDLTQAPGCSAQLERADLDLAYGRLAVALEAIGGAVAAEDNFPAVGAYFADRVVITCQE